MKCTLSEFKKGRRTHRTYKYKNHQYPSVHAILNIIRGEHTWMYKEALTIGSVCHKIIENHILRELKGIDIAWDDNDHMQEDFPKSLFKEYRHYSEPIIQWIKDNPEITYPKLEHPMVSPLIEYGGTIDAIAHGLINDENNPSITTDFLIDWKMAKKMYPDYLLQAAAYLGMVPCQEFWFVRCDKEGGLEVHKYKKTDPQIQEAWKTFQGARDVFRWKYGF